MVSCPRFETFSNYELWMEVTSIVVEDFVSIHRWIANLAPLCWILVLQILVGTSVVRLYKWSRCWPSMQATHRPQFRLGTLLDIPWHNNLLQCRALKLHGSSWILWTPLISFNPTLLWVHAIYQPTIIYKN